MKYIPVKKKSIFDHLDKINDKIGDTVELKTTAKDNLVNAINEVKDSVGTGGGGSIDVVDNLESTDTNKALSANQGKILNDTKLDKTNAIGRAGTGASAEVFGVQTDAIGDISHAEGMGTVAVGHYSHSEGRDTTATGNGSHVEGENTGAHGDASHAEGIRSYASGDYSHAEGNETKAISKASSSHGIITFAGAKCFNIKTFGTASTKTYTLDSVEGLEVGDVFSLHLKNEYDNQGKITEINTSTKTVTVDNFKEAETATEGNPVLNIFRIAAKPEVGTTDFAEAAFAEGCRTKAVAKYAHAEGVDTTVIGNNGHAEGKETVAVYAAHAEGEFTKANGRSSHAEGGNTIASGLAQHVQGKYNIEDSANKYAHIVGNGTSDTNRSNAHTVDWDGNAWFAGDIKIGGTSYDDTAANTIATSDTVVKLTGAQSIAGTKKFTSIPEIPTTTPTKDTQVVNKGYVDSKRGGDIFIYFHMIDTEFVKCRDWTKVGSLSEYCDSSSVILIKTSNDYPIEPWELNTEIILNTQSTQHIVKLKILDNYDIMIKCTSNFSAAGETIASCRISIRNGSYIDMTGIVS